MILLFQKTSGNQGFIVQVALCRGLLTDTVLAQGSLTLPSGFCLCCHQWVVSDGRRPAEAGIWDPFLGVLFSEAFEAAVTMH